MNESDNTEPASSAETQVWQRPAPPEEAPPPEPVFTPFSLTVGDGFKFGCGLTMALAIALMIGILALSILWLLASVVGVAPPFGR